MDSMIYIVIYLRNFGVTEQFLSALLNDNSQEECSEILYDFIFTDTGEQIMGRPSRPVCFRKVWTLWLCNNCLAWLNTPQI